MRRLAPQAALAAAFALTWTPAQCAWLDPCTTARLVASWKHDGLWRTWQVYGPKNPDGHHVRYVGKIRAGGRAYKIYYDLNASHHGHADLVVTAAGGKFLGLYDTIDIDAEPTRTEGADILFPPRKDLNGLPFRDRIHFGPEGPPKSVPVLFGYDQGLATPAEFRKYYPHPWPPPGPRVDTYCGGKRANHRK